MPPLHQRRPARHVLVIALLAAIAAPTLAAAEEAREVFDSLFAAKIKAASATADRADDIALAKDMLDLAKKSASQPNLLVLLCDAVHDLSIKQPDSYATGVEAMQLLADTVEAKRPAARDKLIALLTRQMSVGKPDERDAAGEKLIDLLTMIGDEKAEKKEFAEAAADYRRAVAVATQKKSAALDELKAKLEWATGRDRTMKQLARLQEKLLKDGDSATAEEIVKVYVVELDDPAAAVPYLNRVKDEQLKKLVPLAAKAINQLTEGDCLALGDWYRSHNRNVALGVPAARTKAYLSRFLELHTANDLQRTKADAWLKEINTKLQSSDTSAAAKLTNSVKMRLIRIKAGDFKMGEASSAKQITIAKDFFISATEVTQEQWKTVMATTPWKGGENVKEGDDFPACYVAWDDAVEFCRRLGKKEQRNYRLPREAEWEYACRAGTNGGWSFGSNVRDLDAYGWHRGNAESKGEKYPHRVSLKKPNAWGLFDLHGNVWEWCEDDAAGGRKVIRGGAWSFDAEPWSRSAFQASHPQGSPNYYVGLRVVLDP